MPHRGGARYPGAYQIRKSGTNSYMIGLNEFVGETLYDHGLYYVAQFHDDGLMLKPLLKIELDGPLPEWAKVKADA
jgi:hypothetical protein